MTFVLWRIGKVGLRPSEVTSFVSYNCRNASGILGHVEMLRVPSPVRARSLQWLEQELHCAFHQKGSQGVHKAHDRETAFIQEGSPIASLTSGVCSRPHWNPWQWSTCHMLFPWVKTTMAACGLCWGNCTVWALPAEPPALHATAAASINHRLQGKRCRLLSSISES